MISKFPYYQIYFPHKIMKKALPQYLGDALEIFDYQVNEGQDQIRSYEEPYSFIFYNSF